MNEGIEPYITELKKSVATFPRLPGVYLMKSAEGEIIYIGKARDLRARVSQYLGVGDGRIQIKYLMPRVREIEKIVCESEEQAFLLERDLIGRHKPRYNIRLKDDKAYLSIRVDRNSQWPRLELVRRPENDNADYFGPYTWSYELKQVLDVIRRVLPLRSCSDTVLYNRQRPCLEYQIKRCAGPCCLPVDREEYLQWVDQGVEILQGRTDRAINYLEGKMERAAEELRFEEAAAIRDRIEILENFSKGSHQAFNQGENRDAFALYREGENAAISVLLVRNGRISDSANYAIAPAMTDDDELLEQAIEQFYASGREVPSEILLPIELENESILKKALKATAGVAVDFQTPQRGSKARLLSLAAINARQHFVSKFDAESRYVSSARKLATMVGLKQMPRRIECVDISNLQGSDIVGAIVVFFDGSPLKKEYKRYKISNQSKPDDFAAIHEVVTRRLTRGMESGELPDLLVIDGGPGQLQMALRAREEVGVTVDIISLAKMRTERAATKQVVEQKPERVYLSPEEEPILLDMKDEVTHLLQRIRDEVHRFVITYHKSSRAKRVFRSILDDIPGIGPERKKRLLKQYGSVKKMKGVDPAEFAKNGRMPLPLAEKVLRILNLNEIERDKFQSQRRKEEKGRVNTGYDQGVQDVQMVQEEPSQAEEYDDLAYEEE